MDSHRAPYHHPGPWLSRLDRHWGKVGHLQGLAVGVALSVALAALDLVTGYELSFSFFYLVPVVLVSWTGSRSLVWVISVFDAALWQVTNLWAGEYHALSLVYYWNALSRVVFFVVTGMLVVRVRSLLDHEALTARRDPLTGLLNRRGLEEAFDDVVRRQQRDPGPLAVVSLDLDKFKQLNDTAGHAEGDRLLTVFARAGLAALRPQDTLARIGGDEFVVLVEGAPREGVLDIANRLKEAVEQAFLSQGWGVGVSLGIAFHQASTPLAPTLQRADQQLYRAKNAGRGRVCIEDSP